MTGSTGLGQAPAGGGGQRAALGEQWRINSCFRGQFSLRRKQGGSGYVSLVYFSPNYTLNPDGVNKKCRERPKCIPTQDGGGGKVAPTNVQGFCFVQAYYWHRLTAFFWGGGTKKESIVIFLEVIGILGKKLL